MVQITVSDDLARAIAEAGPSVTLVDSRGRALGQLTRISESNDLRAASPERRAEIERRMREPGTYVPYQTMKNNLGW
ncbi:MAG: hypothetical protein AB7G28_23245 [Pirellulales bacterium]